MMTAARLPLEGTDGKVHYYSLEMLEKLGYGSIKRLPFSYKVLLEAVVRECDGYVVTENDIRSLMAYDPTKASDKEIPFKPARVVLQDFT